jgi:GT2 family glycosyltransferase
MEKSKEAILNSPVLSVIIPTRDIDIACRRLLESLGRQTLTPGSYEAIVVVDGDRAMGEAIRNLSVPYTLRFLRQAANGRAAARNLGTSGASAPLLVFLDDDMEADQNLLQAYLSAHAAAPGCLFIGYFPLPPANGPESALDELIRRWWDDQFEERAIPGRAMTFRDLCTGSMSLAKELFREIGEFDETIGRGIAGEDWEFGYRAILKGKRLVYTPEAVCTHHASPNPRRFFERARENARGHLLLSAKHPDLFYELPIGRIHRAIPTSMARILWTFPGLVSFSSKILRFLGDRVVSLLPRAASQALLNRGYALTYLETVQTALGSYTALDSFAGKARPKPGRPISLDASRSATRENELARTARAAPSRSSR